MELLDTIKSLIRAKLDQNALFDLVYDNQNNVSGYIATDLLTEKSEKTLNSEVWKIINENIVKKDKLKILALFLETQKDRTIRLNKNENNDENNIAFTNKCYVHHSVDGSRYFGFIDVAKFGEQYKTFYLAMNEKYNYKNGMIYNYTKDVISFMEINGSDLYKELYGNAFENLKTTIRMHIINRYEENAEKNSLFGSNNIYSYVYNNFRIEPCELSVNAFTMKEKELLIKGFEKIFECSIKEDVLRIIAISNNIVQEDLT